MTLSFRMLLIAAGVFGIGLGVAFGVGVAYGRGDPKTVETGLTQQQIQSLLGISGASATGGQGTARGTGGQRQFGGAASNTGGVSGPISAVDDTSLTIETRQGSVKVNLSPSTMISLLQPGAVSDLSNGLSIIVSGTRKDDGSYDATAISEAPASSQAQPERATP